MCLLLSDLPTLSVCSQIAVTTHSQHLPALLGLATITEE